MKGLIAFGSSALLLFLGCDQNQDLGSNPLGDDGGSETSKSDGATPLESGPGVDAGSDARSDSAPPDGTSPEGSPACLPAGGMCLHDGECCSNLCESMACVGGAPEAGPDTSLPDGASDADAAETDGEAPDGATTDCPTTEGTEGTVLASGQPEYLHGLAIDDASVYWTSLGSSGIVAKVAKGGGTVVTLASGQQGAWDILCDGTNLYWSNEDGSFDSDTVSSLPVSGGSPTTFWTASASLGLFSLATDSVSLFWGAAGVESEPLGGGSVTNYGAFPGGPFVAVNATSVYYVALMAPGAGVYSIPKGGGTASLLWSDPSAIVDAIAADSTGVYWVDQGTTASAGSVLAIPSGASGATTLASSLNYPNSLTVDGTNVYWADYTGVSKVPIGGGATTVLANEGGPGTVSVKVDATDAYWVNSCFGTVKKIAK